MANTFVVQGFTDPDDIQAAFNKARVAVNINQVNTAIEDSVNNIGSIVKYPGALEAMTMPLSYNGLEVTSTTQTISGVTFTVHDDGTISTSGTSTADISYVIGEGPMPFDIRGEGAGLSGCPTPGPTEDRNKYWLQADTPIEVPEYGVIESYRESCKATGAGGFPFHDVVYNYAKVYIKVKSNTNMTGKVFEPMIYIGNDYTPNPPEFKKYVPSLQRQINDLERRIAALEGGNS